MNFKFDGINELIKKVEGKAETLKEEVQEEIDDFQRQVVAKAKERAPVKLGRLQQGIFWTPSETGGSIIADALYAAFVEFGTGAEVFANSPWVDSDVRNYAAQFKGQGIKKINLKPQPFFFNSFFELKPTLIKNLKAVINERPD